MPGAEYDVTVFDTDSVSVVNIGVANAQVLDVEAGGILTRCHHQSDSRHAQGRIRCRDRWCNDRCRAGYRLFQAVDGTLAGTTWRGPLVLSWRGASALLPAVTGSLTLLNAAGTGSGELDLSDGAEIDFSTLTLDGLAGDAGLQINITNQAGSTFLGVLQNATLTIGSHAHLDLGGVGDVRIINARSGGTFVNNGTITAEAGSVGVSVGSFTNNGLFEEDGGEQR